MLSALVDLSARIRQQVRIPKVLYQIAVKCV